MSNPARNKAKRKEREAKLAPGPEKCRCGTIMAKTDNIRRIFCGPCERGLRFEGHGYDGAQCPNTRQCRCLLCLNERSQ